MELSKTIQKFKDYSIREWFEWLENEINDIPNEVSLPLVDISLDEKLIIIFKKLEKSPLASKNLISASVSLLSQLSFNKSNPGGIYHLILFVGFCKPEAYSTQLELLLKKGVLKDFAFNNINLNHLLLNELINFISISKFDEYFLFAVTNIKDINIKLIGLKYFCRSQPSEKYFGYLESFIVSESNKDKSIKFITSEIIGSFSEFCYIRKEYCSLNKWLGVFLPRLKYESNIFYVSLCKNIIEWLHDENLIIKSENNLCALKIRGFVKALIAGKEEIPSFLNYTTVEGYTFDEFSYNSGNLPPLELVLLEFGNEVNKRTKDDMEISNMINTLSAQLTYTGIRDPEKLRAMANFVLN